MQLNSYKRSDLWYWNHQQTDIFTYTKLDTREDTYDGGNVLVNLNFYYDYLMVMN